MKSICYAIVLQSQLGPRSGELTLKENELVVSGSLSLLGHRTHFSGSTLQQGKYLISGTLRSSVDREPYDAIITVQNGRLSGGLITRYGCWDLNGVQKPSGEIRETED